MAGRWPNTDRLELEWAVGECNGRGTFTHTAWNDHEIVAADLFDGAARRIADRIACCAFLVAPVLGQVDMSHHSRQLAEDRSRAIRATKALSASAGGRQQARNGHTDCLVTLQ